MRSRRATGGNAYSFGKFRLDTSRRILYTGSVPRPIPERPFQVLLALIHARGDVVTRETLAARVWGDDGVTDTNVNQHVYQLRLLLGERTSDLSYIVTVPGEGYRFGAPVTVATDDEASFIDAAVRSADSALDDDVLALYCRGSYLLDRRDAPSLTAAAEAFDDALRLDRGCVPALIGSARAHALLAEYRHAAPSPAFARARAAIAQALQTEPRSSIANAVSAELHLFADWDWAKARKSMVTAFMLDPQSTIARNNAVWYYICRGDMKRALLEARQALLLDPASLSLQLLYARALMYAGKYDDAVLELSNILTIDPSYRIARRYRGQALLLAGRPREAIEDLQSGKDDGEDFSFRLPLLGRAYASIRRRRALEIYERLRVTARTQYVPFWNLAVVAVAIGREDEAIAYLEDALREREPSLLFMRALPWFADIETHPVMERIARQIGP